MIQGALLVLGATLGPSVLLTAFKFVGCGDLVLFHLELLCKSIALRQDEVELFMTLYKINLW